MPGRRVRAADRNDRLLWWWSVLFGVLLVAFAVTTAFPSLLIIGFALSTLIAVGAGVTCLASSVAFRNHMRDGLLLIGTGALLWAACEVSRYVSHMADIGLISGLTQLLWFSSYLAFIGGVFLLSGLPDFSLHSIRWIEAIVAFFSVAAFTETFLLPFGAARGAAIEESGTLVYLSSTVADILLLSLVSAIVVLRSRFPSLAQLLLVAGFFLWVCGDALYFFFVTEAAYVPGGWMDIFWLLGLSALGLSSFLSVADTNRSEFRRVATGTIIVRPLLFRGGALAVLAATAFLPVSGFSLTLALLALFLDLFRVLQRYSELKSLLETEYQAGTDHLTGLPNRRMFYRRLDSLLKRSEETLGVEHAVLLIDLDRFKEINDTLGHSAGDAVLRHLGTRLRRHVRSRDTVARLGGDEFGLVLVNTPAEDAHLVAWRICESLRRPIRVGDMTLSIDSSVGIALFPDHGLTGEDLLQHADIAMYAAKTSQATVTLYQAENNDHSRSRLALMGSLRQAIGSGQMTMHYQPKLDLATDTIYGVESLIRWENPDFGLLYPGNFVPLAEKTGLIRPLTAVVLEASIRQCRHWIESGIHLNVACNLHASSLTEPDFIIELSNMLDHEGVDPSYLCLEITESALLKDIDQCRPVLEHMRSMGIKISLDDYGTGYSSLSYLRQLPFDELKLDRSFIVDIENNRQTATIIIRKAIELAHALNLRAVGEGVENAAMLLHLKKEGCDLIQGDYVSPPLTAPALEAWLQERKTEAGTPASQALTS